jgi:hypothetical protein
LIVRASLIDERAVGGGEPQRLQLRRAAPRHGSAQVEINPGVDKGRRTLRGIAALNADRWWLERLRHSQCLGRSLI